MGLAVTGSFPFQVIPPLDPTSKSIAIVRVQGLKAVMLSPYVTQVMAKLVSWQGQ